MSVDARAAVGGDLSRGATDGRGVAGLAESVAGRTQVKERVLVKVAQQTSSAVIGVARSDVSVQVADYRDGIAVRLSTPLPIPSLDDTDAVRAAVPVLERAAQIQDELRERLGRELGREIVRINLTITGAVTPERRRVR